MCLSLGSGTKANYDGTVCVPIAKLSYSLKQDGWYADYLLRMVCGPGELLNHVQELVGKVLIDPSQNHAREDFRNFTEQTTDSSAQGCSLVLLSFLYSCNLFLHFHLCQFISKNPFCDLYTV